MTQPGDLRESIAMQKKGDGDDGYGGVIPGAGPFETQWTDAARIRTLKGGEEVMAGRLQSVQTFVITMRWQPAFDDVTTAWRAIDARAGNDENGDPAVIYQIKAVTPDERRAYVDLLCQTGVAA